jgi:hypothetical protein
MLLVGKTAAPLPRTEATAMTIFEQGLTLQCIVGIF